MATPSKSILVPIDFSRHSLFALDKSIFLARLLRADLVFLHVIEEAIFTMAFTGKLFSRKKYKAEYQAKAKTALQELIKEKIPSGVSVKSIIKFGTVYGSVIQTAKENNCSMIVMGTHGASGIQELLAGSNASKVVKTATCPVITIREKTKSLGFKKIVLPLDLTRETLQKVKRAVDIANYFDSDLYVISVLMTSDKRVRDRLNKQLELVKKYMMKQRIDCHTSLLKGDNIVEQTLNFAYDNDANLIMIMTRQDFKLTELVWGSQAEQIVNHSRIPVMSVPVEKSEGSL